MDYHKFIKLPDEDGNFTRVACFTKFDDSSKPFYFEPKFIVRNGDITRCDCLYEADDIFSVSGCGFLPASVDDFKVYCREEYQRFKDEEVIINRFARDLLGMTEPAYNDAKVISFNYHL